MLMSLMIHLPPEVDPDSHICSCVSYNSCYLISAQSSLVGVVGRSHAEDQQLFKGSEPLWECLITAYMSSFACLATLS